MKLGVYDVVDEITILLAFLRQISTLLLPISILPHIPLALLPLPLILPSPKIQAC